MEEVPRLVSTGDCVKIWDAVSMTTLEQFNPHSCSHPLSQACWGSNYQYLVTSSSSGDKLVVSSLKSTPVPLVELAEGKKQTRVCLSSSSQFLVSGGLDHCVHLWDLKTRRLQRSLKDHKEEVTCVSFNANDSCIASGSTSGELLLHSLTTNTSSKAFGHGSNQPIHDLRLSLLRRSLLGSVSDSGAVVLWDANTQKELHGFYAAHKAPGSGLVFSPASDLLVVSVGLDKKIICYDTASKIVLRSIRADAPLTSVDFTADGTGVVVGTSQGRILQYDLRNSSSPTRTTNAHKTSVTSLRFYSNRHRSSKLSSTKVSSTKRSLSRVSSGQPDPASSTGPAPLRHVTAGVSGADALSREVEGRQEAEQLPPADKTSRAGRNSLDLFSPVRDEPRTQGTTGEMSFGRSHGTSLELLSREGEDQQVVGRASLDIFSPVREDCQSGPGSHQKPPLVARARCYSPLFVYQTPPPIKEEEPISPAGPEPGSDSQKSEKVEGEVQTTPPSYQQTNNSQPTPPFFTPEPGLRRAKGFQAELSNDSPAQAAAGPASSAATSASLCQNIADMVGRGGGAPLTSLQVHFIQNMIHDTLEDFRDSCHRDIVNLQVEMVRQFYIQLNEIHGLIEKHSVNESLVEEIERLREENQRLKANY